MKPSQFPAYLKFLTPLIQAKYFNPPNQLTHVELMSELEQHLDADEVLLHIEQPMPGVFVEMNRNIWHGVVWLMFFAIIAKQVGELLMFSSVQPASALIDIMLLMVLVGVLNRPFQAAEKRTKVYYGLTDKAMLLVDASKTRRLNKTRIEWHKIDFIYPSTPVGLSGDVVFREKQVFKMIDANTGQPLANQQPEPAQPQGLRTDADGNAVLQNFYTLMTQQIANQMKPQPKPIKVVTKQAVRHRLAHLADAPKTFQIAQTISKQAQLIKPD